MCSSTFVLAFAHALLSLRIALAALDAARELAFGSAAVWVCVLLVSLHSSMFELTSCARQPHLLYHLLVMLLRQEKFVTDKETLTEENGCSWPPINFLKLNLPIVCNAQLKP